MCCVLIGHLNNLHACTCTVHVIQYSSKFSSFKIFLKLLKIVNFHDKNFMIAKFFRDYHAETARKKHVTPLTILTLGVGYLFNAVVG